ncbi:MAG TPA: glycosyltransferase [Thermodesulfobacteriota bacterium]|nr:glycosyltransferase [Thermodesulfobacteriota bacterium]
MDWTYFTLAGAVIWFAVLLLPWRPWDIREFLEADNPSREEDLSDITAVIPARNEAKFVIPLISGLQAQGNHLIAILVDDQSTDGTVQTALRLGKGNLRIIKGEPLPAGWSGKLWALEQGVAHVQTPLTLLLDADIELQAGILAALRKMMTENGLQFVSLMASLRMVSFWEQFFMPAFIYFFRLLYPFHLANSRDCRVAAAAGGCILLETRLLREIGGFKALRGELIDDCALARKVKALGHNTWIGLTHSILSHRPYDNLAGIWNMVARTAFAQLRFSPLSLLLCTVLMLIAFWLPVAGLFWGNFIAMVVSAAGLGAMVLSYLPTLKFYGIPKAFATAMPLIGTFYLGMTWTSALRFWFKEGSEWKGRSYTRKRKDR